MSKENISNYIGRRIKAFRELKGMTQKELGISIGVEHNTISSYETGTNRPRDNILFAIARVLNISINDLFPPTGNDMALITNKTTNQPKPYNPTALTMVPIVGSISCGNGVLVYGDIEGYEPVPDEWLNGGGYFCLRAKGDSMIGARIHDGDLLLIREQPEVENGEIAAVLINDEAVLKKVYRSDGQMVLQSENPNYPPVLSPPVDARVVGKLKKIIINV